MIVLANAATVIASQAVISGAFSVARQAVQLDLLPRIRVLQTSALEQAQIYVPDRQSPAVHRGGRVRASASAPRTPCPPLTARPWWARC